MEIKEYQKNAERTLKHMENQRADLEHMLYGLGSEVGELMSMLKAYYVYDKEFDIANYKEELGDICWFLAGACTIMGISMEEVLEKNINKLKARYPEKFDESLAIHRNLEKEREILES
jgi:NTP pyrophosphatase (non-canonical NTP hydrolase)